MSKETPSIPEYYRQYIEQPRKKDPAAERKQHENKSVQQFSKAYRGNSFTIGITEEWQDKTVYILAGPVSDGIQHNITIIVDPEVQVDSLEQYAELQTATVEQELKGCHLLLKDDKQLHSGIPAKRAIFKWYPSEEVRVYQEQLYVLHNTFGYTLTATFTKKTRKTLGPQVERMMLSFQPIE